MFVSFIDSVSNSVKKEKRPPANDDDDDDVIILSDNESSSPPMNGLSHFKELDTDLLMVMVTHHMCPSMCTTKLHSPFPRPNKSREWPGFFTPSQRLL